MKTLLLTLGHNSSAIYIEDGKLIRGYETERVSGLKSDSQFPMRIMGDMFPNPDMVYVTHWAPDGNLKSMSEKHWDASRFDGIPIRTLNFDRTHHDTHMAGAMCYAGKDFPYHRKTYGLVIDGFGTLGEHLSIYNLSGGQMKLHRRVHGYNTSLGLWYQYATAFMGLKMHEDEYKLLGYEVHIDTDEVGELDTAAAVRAGYILEQMQKSTYGSKYDPMYELNALANIKAEIFSHLLGICREFGISDPHDFDSRALLAYYVQAVLEQVVLTIIRGLNTTNIILAGGVFYNVKLNKVIVDELTDGKTCVYPLAGDQGNAIGLYAMDHPEFEFPDDLFWGQRNLRPMGEVQNLHVVPTQTKALELIEKYLLQEGLVNLVRGNMEFGPRSLCNTSTLALPSLNSVERINQANNRNTVMPMAPVMKRSQYNSMFDHTDRVWKSESHMIVAMEYGEHPLDSYAGITHEYYAHRHYHTGRPQVIDPNDWLMNNALTQFGPLINTSFNYHGMPIALGMSSIITNHMMQQQRDSSIHTVVIQND